MELKKIKITIPSITLLPILRFCLLVWGSQTEADAELEFELELEERGLPTDMCNFIISLLIYYRSYAILHVYIYMRIQGNTCEYFGMLDINIVRFLGVRLWGFIIMLASIFIYSLFLGKKLVSILGLL